MPAKKNQHYVPALCLRHFSIDENRKLINLFHISSKKAIYKVAIKDQVSEDYFYGKDGKTEDAFGLLESDIAPIILKIIDENVLPQDATEYNKLLFFIVSTYTRTKAAAISVDEH